MISVDFQGKSFNITVIEVYATTGDAEEAEVEWFYEYLQDLLELTPKKDVLFIIGDWNAKVGSQEIPRKKESESELALSYLTLCNPMDCRLPCSFRHGIFQARKLEWVTISFSKGSSQARDGTLVSCIEGRGFAIRAAREVKTPGVRGKFGLAVQNEAGQRLIGFFQEKTLVMANTLFQQHKKRLYTWASPDGQH